MRYQTQGNYVIPPGDEQDPVSMTEQAGYIPPELQVERFIQSGKRLWEYRKQLFDLEWRKDLDPDDVDLVRVREKNYDLADMTADSLYLKMKVKEEKLRRLAAEAKQALDEKLLAAAGKKAAVEKKAEETE